MPQENIYWLTIVFLEHSTKEHSHKLKPREKKIILFIKVKSRKAYMHLKVEPYNECLLTRLRLPRQNRRKICPRNKKLSWVKIYIAVLVLPATNLKNREFPMHFPLWQEQII